MYKLHTVATVHLHTYDMYKVKTTLVWQHTQVQSRWSFFASSLTGYNSYMYTLYTTLRSTCRMVPR